MRIEILLIMFLTIGVVTIGLFTIITNLSDEYDVGFNDPAYSEVYSASNDTISSLNNAYNNLSFSVDKEANFFTGIASGFSIARAVIRAPFSIGTAILNTISQKLGLDWWILPFISGILLLFVVFAILGMLLRWYA